MGEEQLEALHIVDHHFLQLAAASHIEVAQRQARELAVSRAKRRIYVIGDRRKWSAYPYFDVLDGHLPVD